MMHEGVVLAFRTTVHSWLCTEESGVHPWELLERQAEKYCSATLRQSVCPL